MTTPHSTSPRCRSVRRNWRRRPGRDRAGTGAESSRRTRVLFRASTATWGSDCGRTPILLHPKKPKKRSPPPPPPKAEPIMYECTVSVSKTVSSKELDDLETRDMFSQLPSREVEVGDGVGDP